MGCSVTATLFFLRFLFQFVISLAFLGQGASDRFGVSILLRFLGYN